MTNFSLVFQHFYFQWMEISSLFRHQVLKLHIYIQFSAHSCIIVSTEYICYLSNDHVLWMYIKLLFKKFHFSHLHCLMFFSLSIFTYILWFSIKYVKKWSTPSQISSVIFSASNILSCTYPLFLEGLRTLSISRCSKRSWAISSETSSSWDMKEGVTRQNRIQAKVRRYKHTSCNTYCSPCWVSLISHWHHRP
jgi:hypothetical protein